MATLLVVDRDDNYLPRGWVSTVLPDGLAPSDYERNGHLWKAVEVPAGTVEKVGRITPGLRAMIFDKGSLTVHDSAREVLKERLSAAANLKPAPGPGHLDRSHSTVWDYGPGRTYSAPQAAFDALLAQEGGNEFTETHYLRGWSGTYPQDVSTAVLCIQTAAPTARNPLVVDAEASENVVFNDQNGPVCVAATDVNHVWVRSLKLAGASVGIIAQVYQTGSVVDGWVVEECEFDGSEYELGDGMYSYKADLLRVRKCWFHHLGAGIGKPGLWPEDDATRIELSGCLITDAGVGISTRAPAAFLIISNTIQAGMAGISHEGAAPLTIAGMVNNIFAAGHEDFNCIQTIDIPPDQVRVMRSDGNCFFPGTNGSLANIIGVRMDLADWRERFHQDDHSIEADPELNEDFSLAVSSPCLGAGVCWDVVGRSGVKRAESIDMGAEQATRPRVPGVTARRRPEIGRRR